MIGYWFEKVYKKVIQDYISSEKWFLMCVMEGKTLLSWKTSTGIIFIVHMHTIFRFGFSHEDLVLSNLIWFCHMRSNCWRPAVEQMHSPYIINGPQQQKLKSGPKVLFISHFYSSYMTDINTFPRAANKIRYENYAVIESIL